MPSAYVLNLSRMQLDKMSPAEKEKKLKRRERNKEAAARCRQRRIETMSELQTVSWRIGDE